MLFASSFGGFLQFLHREKYEDWDQPEKDSNGNIIPNSIKKCKISSYKNRLIVSLFMGIGGGIAITLAIFVLKLLANNNLGSDDALINHSSDITMIINSETNKPIFILLWVMSGFIGHRILPLVANQIERKLQDTDDKATKASKEAHEAKEKTEDSAQKSIKASEDSIKASHLAEIAYILAFAREAKYPDQLRTLIEKFKVIINRNGTNDFEYRRQVYFNLASVYKKLEEYDNAINTINQFISLVGNNNFRDYADSLFNLACYKTLAGVKKKDEKLLESAIQDLEKSIEIQEENRIDSILEPDFEGLRQNNHFQDKFFKLVPKKPNG
jgi:tetratricopeptide (TPR) repeat protein